MSKARQKGTAAETAVVEYLRHAGFRRAERRSLNGRHDRGDVAGIDGVVIEVKNQNAMDLAGWLKELEVEMSNEIISQFVLSGGDGAPVTGAVIHKKRGTTDVGEWYATLPVELWVELLIRAGIKP